MTTRKSLTDLDLDSGFKEGKRIFQDRTFWRSLYPSEFSREEIKEGLEEGLECIESEGIIPCWDSTDHLHFICRNCHAQVRIVRVSLSIVEGMPTVFFYGYCDECGKGGTRKIYLTEDKPRFKKSYDDYPLLWRDSDSRKLAKITPSSSEEYKKRVKDMDLPAHLQTENHKKMIKKREFWELYSYLKFGKLMR